MNLAKASRSESIFLSVFEQEIGAFFNFCHSFGKANSYRYLNNVLVTYKKPNKIIS